MNLSKFFIDRPIFAAVLSILIFVAGLLSLRSLPISEYPDVVPPTIVVRAQYPGANPRVIAETVATPIEEAVNGVEGMLYMSSQATTDGVMTLNVTFRLGTDPDKAQQLVQNRVSQAEPRLPEEVRRLGVTTVKSSPDLTIVVHLLSPNNRYDLTYLRNYALLNVRDRLARVQGVGQVQIFGGGDYSLRVWLDPQKVAEHGLSPSDVVREIRAQNVQAAAGVIGASPSPAGLDLQLSVNAQGRLQTEEDFGDIIVRTGQNGAVVRLRDIARIELGSAEYSLRSLLDNKPAVGMGVFQAPGSNAIAVSDSVRAVMEEIRQVMPEGVEYRIAYDTTQFVRASIRSVVETLLEAVLLVVLVVIVFLQTWRASIIPLVAVPVSIVGTFAVMYVFGFSINALSLFGLVLAIGIVVDDAIVVVENVERNIEDGLSPREATYKAMREVSGPIIAIALVLVAVFVPLAFISGLTGQFYRQFALTIAISTVISAINSLTLSPALAAMLLRGPRRTEGPADTRHGHAVRLVLPRLQPRLQGGLQCLWRRGDAHPLAQGCHDGRLSGAGRPHRLPVPNRARRLRAQSGQAVPRRFRAAPRCGHPRPHGGGDAPHERDRHEAARRRGGAGLPRPVDQRLHQFLQCRHRLRDAEAVRGAARAEPVGRGRSQGGCRANMRRSPTASSACSRRRRFRASVRPAGSRCRSRTARARVMRHSPRPAPR
jgi:multidrug efflux pump